MAEITAGMVKELREATGLGMMDCKKALVDTNGDFKAAEELLRIKSGAKASKASSRVAAEGVISSFVTPDGKIGAVVEVNCETDFVAKNDDFIAFANSVAQTVAKNNPSDIDALANMTISGGSGTVEDARKALVMKLGENMTVRRFSRFETSGKLATYLHGSKIGVLLDFAGEDTLGKDLAMHIAASKPKSVDASGVSAEEVATERRIAIEKAKEAGKPEAMLEKIAEGSVQKFLKDVTLLGQVFVKAADGKQTVEQLLKSQNATVKTFQMFIVGEGIEKVVVDYAAEVAAISKG
ncbi:MAG: translation elongation factor Ts [Gallionellales bacterium 35-53-114]|jgi:elongation factor Ts|nr:MAG: translation elongation factor Ts [Gallionellales bacterium 35-53-114]OYZ65382.1 MAG: translation elongation factor Ts [Gallionellales bacterium 24-53-125]OZB08288.1 MAG: translation elongation factor Ts [Gallionellales bacterium 39-52-133]HQS58225.1 translation elongation factor Ts [Gallionellaceae bacterium]HQS73780.1 translation elongation factor Ts [Gallionellaceae bacterium]